MKQKPSSSSLFNFDHMSHKNNKLLGKDDEGEICVIVCCHEKKKL